MRIHIHAAENLTQTASSRSRHGRTPIGILHETGVPVHIAEDPMRCVARGAGIALDYIDVIERSLPTEEETLIGEMSR